MRATISGALQDDLFSVLLPQTETEVQIVIAEDGATMHNGAISAHISPSGCIHFFETTSGKELLAEISLEIATRLPGRSFQAVQGDLFHLEARFRSYEDEQFYGLMQLAQEKGIPPMRPLFFDFTQDKQCLDIDDQFLFGPDLLVAPVLTEGAREREVYLPAGITWTDAWTGQQLDGGQRLFADAPLERIPLYIRGQAHLPLQLRR